ncbi:MAG: GTPase obg [Candidatus Moranbacteria bacterium GW2011_GWE1_49_15]|nr:MAG: GTPase obg [Candidatus Moranbacteria bacterium GW2011_GWE2_47_10]KKW06957.1 MAG: GTPase obg [Candidatus Moranbacteria bacterium GW2011_GWE1_49_15]HBP01399.1 GTPase ObgE [Candidatus Moranbacteria bacterium]
MLIDDVKLKITAGKGGTGAVNFNKNMMMLGPTGGSGGDGGSVFVEGISDLGALGQFRFKKEIRADDGKDGRGQFRDGSDGPELVLQVPVGTVLHNLTKNETHEITSVGQKVLLAKGGNGGKGNFLFRSARNTSPEQFQEGLPGESFDFRLELKMIADVGFVGLPNVGKSSLLNELTNASAKVANYRFTTLEPNLGVHYGLILADIPGLIEGASEGKGLGHKFLKHIERTKVLFHFLAADSENPLEDYETIRAELGAHNSELLGKPEHILISRADTVSPEELKKKIKSLKKLKKEITPISILDDESLKQVKKILNKIADEKTA